MKKSICLLLALLLTLALCACRQEKSENDPSLEPLPTVDGPVNESADLAGSPFVGLFKNSYSSLYKSAAQDVYTAPGCAAPELSCGDDGRFTFTAASAAEEKSYVIEGTFTVEGDTATFTIETHESSGYLGDDAQLFVMTLINENEMRYIGDQVATVTSGDIFTRQ